MFGTIITDQQILDEGRTQCTFLTSTDLCCKSMNLPEVDFSVYKKYLSLNNEKINNINLLMRIGKLKDGWDGEHAKEIDESLINQAISLVIELNYQPEIFPTACGTIQMEYEKEDGSYLELEVSDADSVKVFSIDKNGNEKTDYLEATAQEINEAVDSFYG